MYNLWYCYLDELGEVLPHNLDKDFGGLDSAEPQFLLRVYLGFCLGLEHASILLRWSCWVRERI
jgi:hypothetical protein